MAAVKVAARLGRNQRQWKRVDKTIDQMLICTTMFTVMERTLTQEVAPDGLGRLKRVNARRRCV